MQRFAAVVVTYYPDKDIIDNLVRLASLCDKVIVVDNTPIDKKRNFPQKKNILIKSLSNNAGLACALNQGIEFAHLEGYENIFLLDQDSRPSDDYFNQMLRFKSDVDKSRDDYAFYVPNVYDRNSQTFTKFPLLTRFTLRHINCKNIRQVKIRESHAVISITSGMLITSSRFKQIGSLRDDYFIDFIDNEYCLRANQKGFKIAINCNAVLDHAIGKRSFHRFCGITIKPNWHPPVRRYYISRNGVRTAIDFRHSYPSYIPLIMARMIYELFSIVLYENQKLKKILAFLYGIYHGIVGNMGKCRIESITP